MYKIVGTIKNKNKIVAYDLLTSTNDTIRKRKDEVVKLIQDKKVSNASVQIYKGNAIIRVKDEGKIVGKITTKNHTHTISNSYAEQVANSIRCNEIDSGIIAIDKLNKLKVGTPLKVRVIGYGDFEQTIYLGKQEVQGRDAYLFFNGQGVEGYFALSKQFVVSNKDVALKFYDNDPTEVNFLLNYIKKGPFNINI